MWRGLLVLVLALGCRRVERTTGGRGLGDAGVAACGSLGARGRAPALARDQGGTLYAGWIADGVVRVAARRAETACWQPLGAPAPPPPPGMPPALDQLALAGGAAGEVVARWVTPLGVWQAARFAGGRWRALALPPSTLVSVVWASRWVVVSMTETVGGPVAVSVLAEEAGDWRSAGRLEWGVAPGGAGLSAERLAVASDGTRVALAAVVCSFRFSPWCRLRVALADGAGLREVGAEAAHDPEQALFVALAPGAPQPELFIGSAPVDGCDGFTLASTPGARLARCRWSAVQITLVDRAGAPRSPVLEIVALDEIAGLLDGGRAFVFSFEPSGAHVYQLAGRGWAEY